VLGLALSLTAVAARGVSADPVTVTSGTVRWSSGDPAVFQLVGDGFLLRGFLAFFPAPLQTCQPCAPGSTIGLSTTASGALAEWVDRPDLPNLVGGANYPTVFYSGDVMFNAGMVTLPPNLPTFGFVDLQRPFTFNGQLTAFGTSARNTNPLFAVALKGTGLATLRAHPVEGVFDLDELSYTFSAASASPTPEPASLLLISAALFGMRKRLRIG
jgi:hypothetical protein